MAVTQDGTHRFAIPNSPLTINSVTYIAEDITYEEPTEEVEIMQDDGTVDGRAIIDKPKRISGTLQLATENTALPTRGLTFSFEGTNYYYLGSSRADTQAQYSKVSFTAVEKIN